ncbi:MAG: DUF4347 domain-containing protein [Cyanobacteria bacterium P01_E01_bin.42]
MSKHGATSNTSQHLLTLIRSAPGEGILAIVDRAVDRDALLAEGALSGAKVLFLEPTEDGILQIDRYLANLSPREKIQSLHIISHGAPGTLSLGKTQLNSESLAVYAPLFRQWRSRFNSPRPEILLYGCEVAKDPRGREFVEQLGRLTGANIAASNTLTGNAALGGNWELDYRTGRVDAPLAFKPEILAEYPSIFATFNVNANDTAGLISAITQANDEATNPGSDTIILSNSTFSLTASDNTDPAFGVTGLPIITSTIVITGNGSTIERSASASENFRLFFVDSTGNLTLDNVTLQGGYAATGSSLGDDGGALFNRGGTVAINDSTITNNTAADDGGGLSNVGIGGSAANMRLTNTTISNNVSQGDGGTADGGGAIDNDGNFDESGAGATLDITGGSITGNTATGGQGGGIRSKDGSTLTISGGTSITGNTSSTGGGIATDSSNTPVTIALTSITVTGNTGGSDVEEVSGTAPTANNGGSNTIGSSNITEFTSGVSVTRTDTGATISSSENIDLGTLIVGVAPVVTTFQIANSGGADLNITTIPNLSGSSFFSIDTSSFTTTPTTIASGSSTTFDVTFDPSTVGAYNTTISFDTDNASLATFSFTMSATVADSTPTDPTDPTDPTTPVDSSILSVNSSTNIFTAGGAGGSNLEVSLQGAVLSTLSTIKLLRLDASNQTTSTLELFSALPNSFRPSGFEISQQTLITETFASGDRFALELTDLDGSTTSFSSGDLNVSNQGSGVFNLNFINGLSLQIQQTTSSIPLGVGTKQTSGLEVIDLLSVTGSVQGRFEAYREANFDNVVGLYKIDDINGTVAGIAPGDTGYARAAIENRVSNLALSPSNQSQTGTTISLDGSSLYAPYIIVNSTPTGFLIDNPNNSVGSDINAYFLYTAANPDRVDHLVLLGNNTFGFEDLFNGGDRDYNDLIFTVDLTV